MEERAKITPNQAVWIFDRSRDFMKQWLEHPPISDNEWQELFDQLHNLEKRGRDHPLLVGIMVQVLNSLEEQSKIRG